MVIDSKKYFDEKEEILQYFARKLGEIKEELTEEMILEQYQDYLADPTVKRIIDDLNYPAKEYPYLLYFSDSDSTHRGSIFAKTPEMVLTLLFEELERLKITTCKIVGDPLKSSSFVIYELTITEPYLREDHLQCYKERYSVIDCKDCVIFDSCTLRHDWEQKNRRKQNV